MQVRLATNEEEGGALPVAAQGAIAELHLADRGLAAAFGALATACRSRWSHRRHCGDGESVGAVASAEGAPEAAASAEGDRAAVAHLAAGAHGGVACEQRPAVAADEAGAVGSSGYAAAAATATAATAARKAGCQIKAHRPFATVAPAARAALAEEPQPQQSSRAALGEESGEEEPDSALATTACRRRWAFWAPSAPWYVLVLGSPGVQLRECRGGRRRRVRARRRGGHGAPLLGRGGRRRRVVG